MNNEIHYEDEEKQIEYIRDQITGEKKPLMSILNKKTLTPRELDELFIHD